MRKPPPIANLPAFETAPRVNLVAGEVVLLGPGATGFSMTPAAARELQDRLGAILRDYPP
ncbi:MAG: hypothetical protein JWR84_370 [Caulobacter sp.]|nr:hypothetical protein [Caulobacter sp.]